MRSALVALIVPAIAALPAAGTAVATAAPAPGGPLAQLSADVDGNGTPDAIELRADGVLRIGAASVPLGAGPAAPAGVTAATLAVAPVRGKPAVVVRLTTARGAEAVIVTPGPTRGAGWQVAWRGEVGGVGLDAEYQVEVAALPTGVVRYQTRWDVRRCDGKPARLFLEDFDGAAFVPAASGPIDVSPGATVLAAQVDAAVAPRPQLYQARLASAHAGAADAGSLAIANELDDGRADTAWRIDRAPVGQFVSFVPRAGAAARELRVLAGDQRSASALAAANRPHELAIVSEHDAWRVELPDAARAPLGTAYTVALPAPVTGCLTVMVASTYGAAGRPTAISELEVFAEGERVGGGLTALAHAIAADAPGGASSAQQLARGGAGAVAAIETELVATSSRGARQRLVRVLAAVHDPSAAPLLARAASDAWVAGADLETVVTALGALAAERELGELAGDRALAVETRVAAARAIDPAAAGGSEALTALAGSGPRELRRVVSDRFALLPAAATLDLARAAQRAAASADLWRAAAHGARLRPAERASVVGELARALPTTTDYERRYRIVAGLAELADGPALTALGAWLAALPAGTEASALRQVAARAVRFPAPAEARTLLAALAGDADPGVRVAALSALVADDDAATDGALASRLGKDRWTEVRIAAAQALSGRCARTGPAAALTAAAGTDRSLDVRGEALVALVHCHAAGVADLLARTWSDGKLPTPLRVRAVGLAIALEDRALGARLVAQLPAWRASAVESAPALALAVEATNAIGRLAPPGAAAALTDALDDAAFPELVGAAAYSLGVLGPACPPAARAKLGALARSDDPQIATPARRAERSCGK